MKIGSDIKNVNAYMLIGLDFVNEVGVSNFKSVIQQNLSKADIL